MRTVLSLWLPALAALAEAGSSLGQVYFYEQQPRTPSRHHTINPKTAALILASRLGVAQYHDLGVVSDDSLSAINDFGNQKKLFDTSDSQAPVALLLSTSDEGVDSSSARILHISSTPSWSKTTDLFDALAAQKSGSLKQSISSVNGVTAEDNSIIQLISEPSRTWETTRSLQNQGFDVILFISPSKSSSSSSYGSWSLPASLHKRQAEAPLEDFSSLGASDNKTSSSPSRSGKHDANSTVLAGILPFCYSTKSACEATTRNCTGHGSCRLAYTQRGNTDDTKGVPCFSCSCTPSVRQNKNGGKKTTVWGGPACQKKDITTPFWLLASLSVFMVFLVSWGIGTLYSMGDEELPSVIGAGVSGVSKK